MTSRPTSRATCRVLVPEVDVDLGFIPSSIAGLACWLNADNAASITASGGLVGEWRDTIGGNVLTSSGDSRPAYQTLVSGRNAVSFGRSTADTLVCAAPSAGVTSAQISIFVACTQVADVSQYDRIFSLSSDSVNLGVSLTAIEGSNQLSWRIGANAAPAVLWQGVNAAAGNILSVQTDGYGTLSYHNGAATFWVPTAPNFGPAPKLVLGLNPGAVSYRGMIFEVLIYGNVIGDSDRQAVEGYLAHRWGLSAQLAADHPYKLSPPEGS